MNKQDIITQYQTSMTKLNQVLGALAIDLNTEEFTPAQTALLEQVWYFVRQENKTYKQAIALVTHQPTQTVVTPELSHFLERESMTFANQVIEETPGIIKEQQAVIRRYIIDSFWKRINEIGCSEEFQRRFDAALYGDKTLDVSDISIQPEESALLLKSSPHLTHLWRFSSDGGKIAAIGD
ncbi:hypothetical protein [Picosynechococcus sp. NKBG042902]|uniref:hypothetical protein n=1 Tax=Picosynechococcus sp. NKBG042902 TaxID=490193 RepID=UPI0004AAE440|nr:hypothetical protein [Picosynechococcus sp. NKBG042902]